MVKYKVTAVFDEITKVEVERETKKQIVMSNGNRSAKISDFECYFDTFKDAKQYLLELSRKSIESLKSRLEFEQKKLDKRLTIKELE